MAEKPQEALATSVMHLSPYKHLQTQTLPPSLRESALGGLLVKTDFFTSFFSLLKMLHIMKQEHV